MSTEDVDFSVAGPNEIIPEVNVLTHQVGVQERITFDRNYGFRVVMELMAHTGHL